MRISQFADVIHRHTGLILRNKLELTRLLESESLESTLLHNFEESRRSQLPKSLYFTIVISGVGVAVLTPNPLFSGVMLESESQISGFVSTLLQFFALFTF